MTTPGIGPYNLHINFAWSVLIALVLLAGLLSFHKVDRPYPKIAEDLKKRRSNE